ncbi:uncharacterized protein [Pempheris klunzingeri]|uniref:uncharacterized protein n=1 Tax=Pempheris klunzingeri TaxID=3127111 RepID=UPI00397F98E5
MQSSAKHNTHSSLQELLPKAQGSKQTPEKSLRLQVTDTHVPDLRTPTPEREAWSLAALIRTPTPDGFLPHTPTPDSQTHTPDPRSHTPEFRTPTSDISDGYISSLSTTSEEYYECGDSSFHELVFDQAAYRNHGTTEEYVSFTYPNPSNVTTITISPTCMDYNAVAAKSGTTDRNTSSSDTQSLSGPASVSSMGEETVNEESGREGDEKGRKPSVAQRKTEGDPHGTDGGGSKEAKRTTGHFKQGKDSTETVEKTKEAQSQAPKRKKELNQSERLVYGGVTPGELINEEAEPKRWSTGDLKLKKVALEGERPDKVKEVGRATLGPSGQDSEASSPSRPSRPLLTTQPSGARPGGSRQLNQAESKVPRDSLQVSVNASSPRRLPSRPPPPVTAGRRHTEDSHSQQSLLSRRPPTAQGKVRAGQSPSQHPYPKPQPSFLHTHSNIQLQLPPYSESQTASARKEHCLEEGRAPFSFTFSKLYNLKGLKDRMSKLPAQSKKGSTSSAVEGRKSTS